MRNVVLLVWLALAGCHAGYGFQWGVPGGGHPPATGFDMRLSFPSDSVAGAVLIGVLLADGVRYYLRLPDGTRIPYYGVPEPDPARRINVQDCTRPVDPEAGNLMCR